jgi:hypothetical protein
MRKLIYTVSTLILISCSESNVPKTSTQYKVIGGYNPLDLVIIDSCEYLFGEWGNATVLTHKGNCKNHKNK